MTEYPLIKPKTVKEGVIALCSGQVPYSDQAETAYVIEEAIDAKNNELNIYLDYFERFKLIQDIARRHGLDVTQAQWETWRTQAGDYYLPVARIKHLNK